MAKYILHTYTYIMSKTRVSIPFSQRGPIPIHLEDSYTGSPTGCSVIDVIFPQGEEISEVRFRFVKGDMGNVDSF